MESLQPNSLQSCTHEVVWILSTSVDTPVNSSWQYLTIVSCVHIVLVQCWCLVQSPDVLSCLGFQEGLLCLTFMAGCKVWLCLGYHGVLGFVCVFRIAILTSLCLSY